MASTLTPRAKFTLDAAGQIGVQHSNWDRADEISGIWYTTSAAGEPAVDKRYDGMVVAEKDTGISYQYLWNGTSFDKRFVTYPLYYHAQNLFTNMPPGAAGTSGWGWESVFTTQNVNAPEALWREPGSNFVWVRVKGIYTLRIHAEWTPKGFAGQLDVSCWYNGAAQYPKYHTTRQLPAGYGAKYRTSFVIRRLFAVDTKIGGHYWNDTGNPIDLFNSVELTMVRPVA